MAENKNLKLKATGIIRRVDDLGRIVIPREIRRNLRLKEGDPMELFVQDDMVCFKKYNPAEDVSRVVKDAHDAVSNLIYDGFGASSANADAMKEAEALLRQAYEKIRFVEENS